MSGCDRCGHTKREHNIKPRGLADALGLNDSTNRLCSAPVGGLRMCMCPKYLKPGTMA